MMHPEYILLGFALVLVALAVLAHFVVKERVAEFNRQTQLRESQKQKELQPQSGKTSQES